MLVHPNKNGIFFLFGTAAHEKVRRSTLHIQFMPSHAAYKRYYRRAATQASSLGEIKLK